MKEYRIKQGVLTEYVGPGGEIVIPEEVRVIRGNVFYAREDITSVTLPEGITKIGDRAFYKCTALMKIVIPNSVTIIGEDAFYGCTALETAEIGREVEQIGITAFGACTVLREIKVHPENRHFDSPDGNLVETAKKRLLCMRAGGDVFVLAGKISIIGAGAFCGRVEEQRVCIPEGVTEIEGWAFADCPDLTEVVCPFSLTAFGAYPFVRCDALRKIYVPDPDMCIVTNLKAGDVSGLSLCRLEGEVPRHVPFELVTEDGVLTGFVGDYCGDVVLPSGIVRIGEDAFRGCETLTSLVIPEGVAEIGTGAFYGCTALERVTLPTSLQRVANNAFRGCEALTTVQDLSFVKEVGAGAFAECSSLAELTFSHFLQDVAEDAFRDCFGLKTVTLSRLIADRVHRMFATSPRAEIRLLPVPETSEGANVLLK